jgi:guanylate-binding protein 1/3/4/7
MMVKTTGNAFGRDIEFREGAPVQLLKYVEGEGFGKIVLNPEALDILQTIREPLAIISVGKKHFR